MRGRHRGHQFVMGRVGRLQPTLALALLALEVVLLRMRGARGQLGV